MIRLAAEAWVSVIGSWKLLTFKTGWQSLFDISVGGFWRSFGAALVALPLVLFASVHQWHLSGSLYLAPQLILYGLSWIVFPAAAAIVVAIVGARDRFVHWVILHNWGVVLLYALTTLMWTLHTAKLIDTMTLGLFYLVYEYLRLLVHWRIAYMALGVPTITSAVAAAVPVLAMEIVARLVMNAYGLPEAG